MSESTKQKVASLKGLIKLTNSPKTKKKGKKTGIKKGHQLQSLQTLRYNKWILTTLCQ